MKFKIYILKFKKISIIFAFLFFGLCCAQLIFAAEIEGIAVVQNQKITNHQINVIGIDGELLDNIKRNVELFVLKASDKDLDKDTWNRLLPRVNNQILEAIKPYGYYQARIDLEKSKTKKNEILHTFKVILGAPLLISKLNIVIQGDAKTDPNFQNWVSNYPLKIGDILNQVSYESSKDRALLIANEYGYFDSQFTDRKITINKKNNKASIDLVFDSGVRYRYGNINFHWADNKTYPNIPESVISEFVKISKGQNFVAQELLSIQQVLFQTGYFINAEVRPIIEKRRDGEVPIIISFKPLKRYSYELSLGAGTDTGPRANVNFEDRRFNSRGHQLGGSLGVSQNEKSAALNYRIPLKFSPNNSFNTSLSYIDESSDARMRETFILGSELSRVKGNLQWSYGLSYRDESFLQDNNEVQSQLLIPRLKWQKTSIDSLSNPSQGWRLSTVIQGASDAFGSDVDFIQLIANAKVLYSFGNNRLITRAEFAKTEIDDQRQLPSSLRFFAGGDNSIRGYKFESIGFEGSSGTEGARNIFTASLEYEYDFKGNLGLAIFADFGDAFNDSIDIKRGVGLGFRYRLPFGAIRLDLASGLDLEGQPLRIHFTFGTDL